MNTAFPRKQKAQSVFYLYMYSSAMIIISVVVKIPFNCSPCKDTASPKGSFANGFNSKE